MPYSSLDVPVHVSTPVADSIMVDRVFRSCVIIIVNYETRLDLLLLSMFYFDVILGMHLLSLYHDILDCQAKIIALAMPDLPRLEWKGALSHIPSRVISFSKAQQIVGKGCLAYLDSIRDYNIDTPIVDSVQLVR